MLAPSYAAIGLGCQDISHNASFSWKAIFPCIVVKCLLMGEYLVFINCCITNYKECSLDLF